MIDNLMITFLLWPFQVGAQMRSTHVIKKDLNPRWDEVFEYIVDEVSGQMLEVEVYDKDDGDKDDFLGR